MRSIALLIPLCLLTFGCQTNPTEESANSSTENVANSASNTTTNSSAENSASATSFAPVDTSKEIIGSWKSTKIACSSGATPKGGPTSMSLDVTEKKLTSTFFKGKAKDVSVASPWKIQENLLTLNVKGNTSTMEAMMRSRDTLLLRIPLTGVPGDCPASDLLVAELNRVQ